MRRVSTAAGVTALFCAVLLVPGSAGAEAASLPSQVVAAWSFDEVTPEGSVANLAAPGGPLLLGGAWSVVSGSTGTPAVSFATQSFGSTEVPDPATQEFAVSVVLRNLKPEPFTDSPNVVQDGLYRDPGQIKLQLSKKSDGRAECRFKGTTGAVLLHGPAIKVTDGAWHTVTCWRQAYTVGVTVDGVTVSKSVDVGSITSERPLTVAGRGLGPGDLSDQFVGDLDALVWAVGDGAREAAPAAADTLAGMSPNHRGS